MSGHLHLDIKASDDGLVVRLLDSQFLDKDTIEVVGDQLFRLVEDGGPKHVLLDFVNVKHLSSPFLGKLILLYNRLKAGGGTLRFCNVEPRVFLVLEVARLDRLFGVTRDPGAATPEGAGVPV